MGFRALLYAYVIGGLTFIPLLIAAILIPAWYLLPRAEIRKSSEEQSNVETAGKDQDKAAHARKLSGDSAASGTYAVLRRYDFQAALSALNGRQNSTVAVGGNTIGDDMLAAESAANASGGSVYQTMYRSVFTGGSKNSGSTTSLLQSQDEDPSVPRRKPAPANLLYIVLRHGHLMLYDSPAQVEVKHVLSLAHHKVSLQAGKDGDPKCFESNIAEADLFTKRTAIVLTPVELPNGTMQAPAQAQARPFYLFTATNIEKEDFYHALVSNRSQPPIPRSLDSDALIKLQSSLHSSSLTAESRAIDALIGRVFLALHQTESMNSFVRGKLEKKLNRIQKPAFIPSLLVQSIHLGNAGPVFSNLKLRDLNIEGEMTLTADIKYTGGLSVTLLAVAKLDLGSRFKVRTVDLALKTVIQRITGTMLLRIKPPPSNRIWFCFESVPEMDVRVEPIVSERKITYGFVLRAIEERVRTAFKEGLVKPNWDDIPMPFSDTKGTRARGGLWSDVGAGDAQGQPPLEETLAQRNEKTMSLPTLMQENAKETDSGASTGTDAAAVSGAYKVRQATTMPIESASDRSPRPPRPMRTPSVSLPASTAVDGQNVEPVRRDDAALNSNQSRKLWRSRGPANNVASKGAIEELRGLHSRAEQVFNASGAPTGAQIAARRSLEIDSELTGDELESDRSNIASGSTTIPTTRTPSVRSTKSANSTVAPSLASSTGAQSRKANILAATVNATTAAKNWSWNTIQRNKGAMTRPDRKQDVAIDQPMGRGMPLPPPGQPLPGPQKGLWGGLGSLRRRPVAQAQDFGTATSSAPELLDTEAARSSPARHSASSSVRTSSSVEEEFEPWQENSGTSHAEADQRSGSSSVDHAVSQLAGDQENSAKAAADATKVAANSSQGPLNKQVSEIWERDEKRAPPPLPARRNNLNQEHDTTARSTKQISEATTAGSGTKSVTNGASRPASVAASEEKADNVHRSSSESTGTRPPRQSDESTIVSPPEDEQSAQPMKKPEPSAKQNDRRLQLEATETRDLSPGSGQPAAHDEDASTKQDIAQSEHTLKDVPSTSSASADQDDVQPDPILARMQARVAERRSAQGVEQNDSVQHKTTPSIGFSDGWPSH
ncbi:Putative synaptotagmin-like mitochondrial-lipid-binding domain-containing protein [Septoria linicola]|uniref:Synaptotagmin-like mitochondrial-lipid-binding domain-containing protein n=1 Tax=Septoria linicola TaxID=215465 RepID=A0A9Q9EI32_9PEZI|nr:putative synaptotagmin-like mitochondrial-lipid-binding domain-containing protein [Septoria linicola]USW50597.1 Putative synaptotagmin-like mitochondrial-lipid-binding domain-containing protein [Septoria linicola]